MGILYAQEDEGCSNTILRSCLILRCAVLANAIKRTPKANLKTNMKKANTRENPARSVLQITRRQMPSGGQAARDTPSWTQHDANDKWFSNALFAKEQNSPRFGLRPECGSYQCCPLASIAISGELIAKPQPAGCRAAQPRWFLLKKASFVHAAAHHR